MSEIIHPGAGLLFMKVGIHARESLESIISRKTKEIDDAGFAMWGYGGNTCHPTTMVQPFAAEMEELRKPITLVMNEMTSNHWAEQLRAEEFSADGLSWQKIPRSVNVLGSRYALVIEGLRREKLMLPLERTRVAVGLSRGRNGRQYVRGRVDKACLQVVADPDAATDAEGAPVQIDLVATLRKPYAVFLR